MAAMAFSTPVPGAGRLWTDADLPDDDAPASELAWQRCVEFVRHSGW
jgi:hypothetical protein